MEGPRKGGWVLRRSRALIVTVTTLAVVAAACSGGGFHYVKSSEDRTYFKVPSGWTLFDEHDILDRLGADLTESQKATELDQTWRVAFDASPKPSLRHLGAAKANHPSGLAVVRKLTFDVADSMSNSALRNYFFEVDSALQEETGELLEYEELKLDGGFRGIHLVATLTTTDGRALTIDQTLLLDQGTTKVYGLLVTCSNVCYDKHRADIEKVVDSWTVRAK